MTMDFIDNIKKKVADTAHSATENTEGIRSGAEELKKKFSDIKDKALRSALRILALKRTGNKVYTGIKECSGGYIVECKIEDREKVLFHSEVFAPDRVFAEKMKLNTEERAEIIYKGSLALLSGDVNFIFDD